MGWIVALICFTLLYCAWVAYCSLYDDYMILYDKYNDVINKSSHKDIFNCDGVDKQ